MIPIIGITSSYDDKTGRTFLSRDYIQAVTAAGGLPLVLPCILPESSVPFLLELVDGLILSGGVDVDPLIFGEEPHPQMGEICPERDKFEFTLTKQALGQDLPILAICRGVQMLNIVAGGSILQDIGATVQCPVKHSQEAPRWYGTHTINILPESRLAKIWGKKMVVNSYHHQAVGTVGKGFIVSAWSVDGVVEGMESTTHSFVLGVQCHPECMWEKDTVIFQLFREFVQAAKK
ncbi:peptidase C26 [Desulforamulus reducens MI-1]|uniref:Peptidase C26 n=1 Tax=Desulforamulus reducens (strain ATCC BAA-1160 / DSM 100696 / MI-1) TaxID=349161 RepID=A4J8J4_DESRM|nr:gamma-glutamyl-gamma-aminobutyrate hydrolase family protein [Desulforamulus reducens]ABO51397.1 peptidase C26 [Desulforamulus reducens MI-1]